MNYLHRLLNPMQLCEDAAARLLTRLKVPFTLSYLQKELVEHPDYPSLVSIADVTGISYNIASVALKMTREQILSEPGITTPFIAHIKVPESGTLFAVVTSFSNETIELYNPALKKKQTLTPDAFDKIYLDTLLAVEAENNAGEKEYTKHLKEEKRRNALHQLLAFGLPVLSLIICLVAVITTPFLSIVASICFTLLTLTGVVLGALLLWHEVDQYNPVLKQICQAGKKVNCSAILNSKASKIVGLSWSSIGFSYFTGMLLTLLVTGINNAPALVVLSWLNVLALPYIGFSLYYQWKIAKQWCLLCLLVQGVLLLQFITALAGGFHFLHPLNQVPAMSWLSISAAFFFVFIAAQLLVPALQKAKEARQKTIELQRLKHNPQIFEALLGKQKAIEMPPPDLGITLGNPEGRFKLVKVCNPYCRPCAKAHPVMEALAENNEELCLQIIFNATQDDKDIKKAPVNHLLAIDTQNNKELTKKALDDWYNAPVKDYAILTEKYPLNGELKLQEDKIKAMYEWCKVTEIAFTPTFFLCQNATDANPQFYQLPEMYTVADLNYFLTA